MTKDSTDLEILVQKIQKQLSPDAEVLHDVRIPGKQSGRKRQIDVLVRQKIGQYEMLIVLDCKDHARPIDVKGVEEFHGLLTDVGAHKGALVCPTGFSAAAKERAAGLQIDLFSPVDTDPHKWQTQVTAATICDFRGVAMAFGISGSSPSPLVIPNDFFYSLIVQDEEGKKLGRVFETAVKKWDSGKFPVEPGTHEDLNVFENRTVLIDNGYSALVPVDITVSLRVTQQLYFGHLPISEVSGFKDELSGNVITNAFTVGLLDPAEIEKGWKPIDSIAELPLPAFLQLVGLKCYGVEG